MAAHPDCGNTRSSSIPDHRQLLELLERNKALGQNLSKNASKAAFGNQKYQICVWQLAYTHLLTYYPSHL
jgi:hypothetical protein